VELITVPDIAVWIFIGYLAVLVAIGFVSERFTKGLEGFVLGDRQMGPWLTALAYESTAYSGWLMLGLPGKAFKFGLAAVWVCVSCVLGDALNWVLVSRRLREETARLKSMTIPEYLERRFQKPNGYAIQLAASLAMSAFMLIYLWAQLVASGKTIMSMLQWNYVPAVVVSSVVIMLYTFQGGYRAVVWTDAFQAVMMVLALIILPVACFIHIGGWREVTTAIDSAARGAATMPGLAESSSHLRAWFAGLTGLGLFSFLFEDAGFGVGYLGQPHTCVRFMAIKDSAALRPAFILSMIFAVAVCAGAVAVGLLAHGWYRFAEAPEYEVSAGAMGAVREKVPVDLRTQSHEVVLPALARRIMPGWLAGLVISAIMAAIMSTASGFLLSVTSSMTEDVYHRLLRPGAGDRELVLVSRLVTVGLGVGGLLLALRTDPNDPNSTVYKLVLYGWGGLAGTFSAPVTMALLYRKMTREGCLAGILVGAGFMFLWRAIPDLSGTLDGTLPSIGASGMAVVVVSLLSRPLNAKSDPVVPS
jgi:sodium/proline symporter